MTYQIIPRQQMKVLLYLKYHCVVFNKHSNYVFQKNLEPAQSTSTSANPQQYKKKSIGEYMTDEGIVISKV